MDIKTILARKSLTADDAAYRLFVRDKGSGECIVAALLYVGAR
jgi:hypothetical protein